MLQSIVDMTKAYAFSQLGSHWEGNTKWKRTTSQLYAIIGRRWGKTTEVRWYSVDFVEVAIVNTPLKIVTFFSNSFSLGNANTHFISASYAMVKRAKSTYCLSSHCVGDALFWLLNWNDMVAVGVHLSQFIRSFQNSFCTSEFEMDTFRTALGPIRSSNTLHKLVVRNTVTPYIYGRVSTIYIYQMDAVLPVATSILSYSREYGHTLDCRVVALLLYCLH